jgi:hypothetical protein
MKDISYAWTQGKHRPTHQFLVAILQDGNQISFCRTSFPAKGSGAMRENSTRRPGAHLIPPHQISVLSLSDKSISGNSSRQRLSITYLRWPLAVLWAAKAASLEQRPRRQTEALGVAGGGQDRGSRGGTRELGSQLATGDSAKVSDSAADWRAAMEGYPSPGAWHLSRVGRLILCFFLSFLMASCITLLSSALLEDTILYENWTEFNLISQRNTGFKKFRIQTRAQYVAKPYDRYYNRCMMNICFTLVKKLWTQWSERSNACDQCNPINIPQICYQMGREKYHIHQQAGVIVQLIKGQP